MLNTKYYFTHPYSSWERGLNKYTNGFIKQYMPEKEKLKKYSDKEVEFIQHKTYRRPRELLNFVPKKQVLYTQFSEMKKQNRIEQNFVIGL